MELPDKWCVKVTPTNYDVLYKWFHKGKSSFDLQDKYLYKGFTWSNSSSYGEEISFEVFKQYVLSEKRIPVVSDFIEIIETGGNLGRAENRLVKGNVYEIREIYAITSSGDVNADLNDGHAIRLSSRDNSRYETFYKIVEKPVEPTVEESIKPEIMERGTIKKEDVVRGKLYRAGFTHTGVEWIMRYKESEMSDSMFNGGPHTHNMGWFEEPSTSEINTFIACELTNRRVEASEVKDILFEEARKRFPIGTSFYPNHVNAERSGDYCIVTNTDLGLEYDDESIIALTNTGGYFSDDKEYGNTCFARVLYTKGEWANIKEQAPQYNLEVGKWYRIDSNYIGKFHELKNKNWFYATEWIRNNRWEDTFDYPSWIVIDDSVFEPLTNEEVNDYLPDNHIDKIKPKWNFDHGDLLYCESFAGKYKWLFVFDANGGFCDSTSASIKIGKNPLEHSNNRHNSIDSGNAKNIRLVTTNELTDLANKDVEYDSQGAFIITIIPEYVKIISGKEGENYGAYRGSNDLVKHYYSGKYNKFKVVEKAAISGLPGRYLYLLKDMDGTYASFTTSACETISREEFLDSKK